MNPETLYYFTYFYDHVDIFLLILVRVLAFIMFLPVVSSMNIPMQVRILLSVCLSVVIFSSGLVTTVTYENSVMGFFMLILTEFLTGLMMGYIIYFMFNIIYYAGQLIDYQIGLSMMSVLDPMTQIQVPIAGNLYYLAVSAVLVATGGLHSFIGAFYDSYRILPIGVAHVVGDGAIAWYLLSLLTEFLVIGVKIALPIVGALLIIDAALGILVKAVPQMNIFVIGMPLKVLVGILILYLMVGPMLDTVYTYLFEEAYNALREIMWGMAPV